MITLKVHLLVLFLLALRTLAEDHKGRKVICLACSEGIGKAIASSFLSGGANVVISSRTQSKIDRVVSSFSKTGGKVYGIAGDCAKEADIKRVVEEGAKLLGGIDTVIYNPTGTSFGWLDTQMATNTIGAVLDEQFALNVKGLAWATQYALDELIKSTNSPAVISTSSISSKFAMYGNSAYGVSKAAQESLVKSLATEFSHYGIRFFAVVPAFIETEAFNGLGPAGQKLLHEIAPPTHVMGRIGQSGEVAEVVTFLSSSRASFMTGSSIPVDGGMLAWGPASKTLAIEGLFGTHPPDRRVKKDEL